MDKPAFDTRSAMLLAARRLIAGRGVEGVAVRDILKAAGVRNGGALHYYFGTKEDLIRELVEMGAQLIDGRRLRMLDDLERTGAPIGLSDVVAILVNSSIGVSKAPKGEDSYTRFIAAVQSTHPDLFIAAVAGRWDVGHGRIVAHIRRLLPQLSSPLLDHRVMFMSELLTSVLAKREGVLVDGEGSRVWAAHDVVPNLIEAGVSILASVENKPL